MKHLYLFAIIGFTTSSSMASANNDSKTSISSVPSDVELIIYDPLDPEYIRECITPCLVDIDPDRYLNVYTGQGHFNSKFNQVPVWTPSFVTRDDLFIDFTRYEMETLDGIRAYSKNRPSVEAALKSSGESPTCPRRTIAPISSYKESEVPRTIGSGRANLNFKKTPRESAHCLVQMDLSDTGRAQNIETIYCTHPRQEYAARRTLEVTVFDTSEGQCNRVWKHQWNVKSKKGTRKGKLHLPSVKKMSKEVKRNYPDAFTEWQKRREFKTP